MIIKEHRTPYEYGWILIPTNSDTEKHLRFFIDALRETYTKLVTVTINQAPTPEILPESDLEKKQYHP